MTKKLVIFQKFTFTRKLTLEIILIFCLYICNGQTVAAWANLLVVPLAPKGRKSKPQFTLCPLYKFLSRVRCELRCDALVDGAF